MTIKTTIGDVTAVEDRPVIIAHVCNDAGGWGAGFSGSLSKRWAAPEAAYREWHKSGEGFLLGAIQRVPVEFGVEVVNMVAQNGYGQKDRHLDYDALFDCLLDLGHVDPEVPIVMPKIGAGLGGGDWERISGLIERALSDRVTVYLLPEPS